MRHSTLLLCLFATQASWAISNIENERPNLPEEGLSGKIKLAFNGKTGNQEEESDEGAVKLVYRVNDDIFLALAEKEYGTKHEKKNTDNSFLHARWVHLLNTSWAIEGFTQWQKDEFDNLTSRTLAGGGGRYQIAQKKDVYSFAIGLGAFRENEKLDLMTYQQTNRLWRVNSYYSYKYQLNDQVTFANTTYYQPSTTDFENFRVLFDLGLTIKLFDHVDLGINYKLTHDSDPAKNLAATPPIDNYKTNTEYKTSLAYHF